jgi:Skp family chaperone for outer membrane proteins
LQSDRKAIGKRSQKLQDDRKAITNDYKAIIKRFKGKANAKQLQGDYKKIAKRLQSDNNTEESQSDRYIDLFI